MASTPGASQDQSLLIGSFPVPYQGVHRETSEIELPRDAVWKGENVHILEGELRQRPSWVGVRDATVAAPPGGVINGITSARRANTRTHFLVVGTTAGIQVLKSTGWASAHSWGATRDQWRQVRFTELALGTPLLTNLIACNGIDAPVKIEIPASGDPGAATALSGPPAAALWKDVCTASDRIVGITDTEVSWGEILRLDIFPELNVKSLAESLDLCIAVRPIGTLNVGVWKERSFWIGQATGKSSAAYFAWKVARWVEGPASPAALTHDSDGNWYWMTKTGRVVMMGPDFQVSFPGDGIWPITRKDISPIQAEYGVSHAVYRPFADQVWFFYGGIGVPA